MNRQLSVFSLMLLVFGGIGCAQQLPSAPQPAQNALAFLSAAAQAQQNSMPGMQMPPPKTQKQSPLPVSPPGSPGLQTPQGALTNSQPQPQAAPEMQMNMQNMEMHSPKGVASDVSDVQEPENPDKQTGSDSPVIDLFADIRKTRPRNLAEFEQLAASTNPTLRQAEAQVRVAAGLARQAGLLPNPSIGYEGSEIRGGEFGGGEHGAFLQQTFPLGGKLGLRRNVFEQQRKAEEIGLAEQKLNVLGGVRVQFYTALAAQQSAEVRERILKLTLDAAATAHQLANVGQADAPDVLQAEVEAEQAKLDLDRAQRQYLQAFRTLAAVAGHPEIPLALLEGDLENPPAIDPEQIMSAILANSPSVKRAEQQVHQAEAALKRDRREAVPDLTVRAGGQQNFEHTSSGRSAGYESFATASIDLPVFNRNQGNIEASRAELDRAHSEVLRMQLSLTEAAQPLLQQYAADKLQAARYRTQLLPRAQRAYELYRRKYRNMAAAYPEVIISQRTFFQLQEGYVQALGGMWTASIALQNELLTNGLAASGGTAAAAP